MQPAKNRSRSISVPSRELVALTAGRNVSLGWLRNARAQSGVWPGATLPWVLQEKSDGGFIRGTRRNNGTVRKDFCIAVVGHQGWSRDPDSTAKYGLAFSFEIQGCGKPHVRWRGRVTEHNPRHPTGSFQLT